MAKVEKDPVNFVHQNAILCETILKETRHQRIYKNYSVNPYKKSEYSSWYTKGPLPFVRYKGGQRFDHKNTKMQLFENKYAVWLYKSYHNEKEFLKL